MSTREQAARVLDPAVLAYVDGASGTGRSAAEATERWRAHRLRPHVLRDVARVSTATTVAGHPLALPVLAAPCALHGLLHPEAERASAAGVRAAGSLPVVSLRASLALEDMGLVPGQWWQQLYVLQERALTFEVAQRARELGAAALVVTGDLPVLATRAGGKHTLPPGSLRAVPGGSSRPGDAPAPDATLADAVALAEASGLPFWVKGVLRGDDADLAVRAGAAGVVVSNHGGRQLDGAVASADALAEVVDAVAGRAGVLVDGGVRNGTDVVTALALGADAVLLGRPLLWALAVGGAPAVTALLDRLRAEVAEVLALCGLAGPQEVGRDLLAPR